MEINKPIGIDLGTTNSCVGIMNATDSDVILYRDKRGVSTTPSCFWYDSKKNQIIVGKLAFRRRGSRPGPVVSIKRKMGKMLLTPLGKANQIPENIPTILRKVLCESREERLERYLNRIEDNNPDTLETKREEKRQNPPELWIFDQKTRLEAYLKTIEDEEKKENLRADPPLLWLPEEISALILAEEQRQIIETLNELNDGRKYIVDRAVITVPAYFDSKQIEATKEAGNMAGLRVLELFSEPTAAAIFNCWKHNIQDGVFLVFDLGGGTFDVSIVRRTSGQPESLGISGDNYLGGDDMDSLLAEWIRESIAEEEPDYDLELDPDNEEDKLIRNQFALLAEGVKKALSREGETWLRDENTVKDKTGASVMIEMIITQDVFEGLIGDILDRCIPKCWEALARAKKKADISLENIDHVFLVGGSTHVPLVKEVVKERFCRSESSRPYKPEEIEKILEGILGDDEEETTQLRVLAREMMEADERVQASEPLAGNPDLCVSMGAAIQAATYGTETHSEVTGVRIELVSSRGTSSTTIPIKGRVSADSDSALENASVRLSNETLGFDDEIPLKEDGTFVFKDVPLQERMENEFQINIISGRGEVIDQDTIIIIQDPEWSPLHDPELSGPSLSKAYYIDVVRQGRVAQRVLVKSGESLPAEERHHLKVPDPNTGNLNFRIYQARKLLKSIHAPIDQTLPPGTPIHFSFSIARDHLMVCKYSIGDDPNEESAIIEPPPPETPPTPKEIKELNDRIADDVNFEGPVRRKNFENQVKRINDKIKQARTTGDDPKLIDAFEELKELHHEIKQVRPEMKPPWEEYDETMTKCRRLLGRLEKEKPKFPVSEARKDLDEQRANARSAFNTHDQQLYGEYWERLQAYYNGLKKEFEEDPKENKSPAEQASQRIEKLLQLCNALQSGATNFEAQFVVRAESPPEGETAEQNIKHLQQCQRCKAEVAGCMAVLEKLKSKCDKDPNMVLSQCRSQAQILEQSRVILMSKHEMLTGKKSRGPAGDIPWD